MTTRDYWQLANQRPNHENIETDTEWYSHIDDGVLYLSFQGSISRTDWKQNFYFLKTPYKGMQKRFRVHRGFLRKYKSIRDDIWQIIQESGVHKVVIAGFSQGGALALLAHEDIVYHTEIVPDTTVFGCPRVFGWRAPKSRFATVTSVQYGGDIVTGLAPWIFGYKHVAWTRDHVGRWPMWLRIRPDHHLKFYDYF